MLLLPDAWLFQGLAALRRVLQRRRRRPDEITVPVIVVGNITLGGTGKTPLVIALAEHLKKQGLQPGVISRGYGGKSARYPLLLRAPLMDAAVCGDEALLIAEKTGCPVAVAPNRRAAVRHLLASCPAVNVLLSDDGLQHYRLWRDIEIAVVDGSRLLGNGYCLPAGPLREPPSRLNTVDFVVVNGQPTGTNGTSATDGADAANANDGASVVDDTDGTNANNAAGLPPDFVPMEMAPCHFINLLSGEKCSVGAAPFDKGAQLQAAAGIGNPERFFHLLESLSYQVRRFSFPDHHRFTAQDFKQAGFDPLLPVVLTEKDGVKCRQFARPNHWVLKAEARLPDSFLNAVSERVNAVGNTL